MPIRAAPRLKTGEICAREEISVRTDLRTSAHGEVCAHRPAGEPFFSCRAGHLHVRVGPLCAQVAFFFFLVVWGHLHARVGSLCARTAVFFFAAQVGSLRTQTAVFFLLFYYARVGCPRGAGARRWVPCVRVHPCAQRASFFLFFVLEWGQLRVGGSLARGVQTPARKCTLVRCTRVQPLRVETKFFFSPVSASECCAFSVHACGRAQGLHVRAFLTVIYQLTPLL